MEVNPSIHVMLKRKRGNWIKREVKWFIRPRKDRERESFENGREIEREIERVF